MAPSTSAEGNASQRPRRLSPTPSVPVLRHGWLPPDFPGGDLYEVATGDLRARFLPGHGGRLISLTLGDHELLWTHPEAGAQPRPAPERAGDYSSWLNLGGSKTWPAPQAAAGRPGWSGPPGSPLDSGAWALSTEEGAGSALTVLLRSEPDPETGLRIDRRFRFRAGAHSFTQLITLTNVSERSREWAAWEVCQIRTEPHSEPAGYVLVPHTEGSAIIDLGRHAGDPQLTTTAQGVRLATQPGVAKWGFPAAEGSISWHDPRGVTLRIAAEVDPAARYPDEGSRVEIWSQSPQPEELPGLSGMRPDAWYVELEILGPLTTLEPGASQDFELNWSLE